MGNLRVFGCLAYFHINEGKLEPRAKKGLVMGYPSGVKGYRIRSTDERKCITGRDMTFSETDMPKRKINTETTKDTSTEQTVEIEVEHTRPKVEHTSIWRTNESGKWTNL